MAYNDNKHPYQPPTSSPYGGGGAGGGAGYTQQFEPQSQPAADAYSNRGQNEYNASLGNQGQAQGQGQGGWQYDGPRGPAAGIPHGQQQGGHVGNQGPGGVYVVDQPRHSTDFAGDIFLYIIALFIPPAPVVVKRASPTLLLTVTMVMVMAAFRCGGQLCINILLWILGWIPGVIHAFYIIAATPVSRH